MIQELEISVSAFKAKALKLLEEVGRGRKSVVVTKRGKPLARVIPFRKSLKQTYQPGGLQNTLIFEGDIVSPLGKDLWQAAR